MEVGILEQSLPSVCHIISSHALQSAAIETGEKSQYCLYVDVVNYFHRFHMQDQHPEATAQEANEELPDFSDKKNWYKRPLLRGLTPLPGWCFIHQHDVDGWQQ